MFDRNCSYTLIRKIRPGIYWNGGKISLATIQIGHLIEAEFSLVVQQAGL